MNRRIRQVLDSLLSDKKRSRIIIVQGDHGPNMTLQVSGATTAAAAERMSILNAYYVPADVRARLYPSITPVNTFRAVLSRYFGDADPLLPDRMYFSPKEPYDFIDVTREVSSTPAAPE